MTDTTPEWAPIGGGVTGDLIRSLDWGDTTLGPLETWGSAIRTIVQTVLLSPLSMALLIGPKGALVYNDGYAEVCGPRHPNALGRSVLEVWPEAVEFNSAVIAACLAGQALRFPAQPLELLRYDRPEQVWMDLDYLPVLDEDGQALGALAIVRDVTQSVTAAGRLRESEELFRALVNASSDVVYRMSADWQEMRQLEGRAFLTDTAAPSVRWLDTYVPDHERHRVVEAINEAIARKERFELEHQVLQADGRIGWTLSRAIPIIDAHGEIREWFGMAADVSQAHRHEAHLQLIVNELNHRVKNNLAVVQSIAAQTFRGRAEWRDQAAVFAERLMALAKANDLLTGVRLTEVGLRGVIDEATAPHRPSMTRLQLLGPDVEITTRAALAFTLAFHELATNAVKYGAWSGTEGRVTVSWAIDDVATPPTLVLDWIESEGPAVSAPDRRGFGSKLIERSLAQELQGQVTLSFETEGLICHVEAPLTALPMGRGA